MSQFEERFPKPDISYSSTDGWSITKHKAIKQGWLEALKWLHENKRHCYKQMFYISDTILEDEIESLKEGE